MIDESSPLHHQYFHGLLRPKLQSTPWCLGLYAGRDIYLNAEQTRNQVLRASRPWMVTERLTYCPSERSRENPEDKQAMPIKLRAGTAFRHNIRKLRRFVVTSVACDKVQNRIIIGPALLVAHAGPLLHVRAVPVTPPRHNSRSIEHFFLKRTKYKSHWLEQQLLHLCHISTKLSHCK